MTLNEVDNFLLWFLSGAGMMLFGIIIGFCMGRVTQTEIPAKDIIKSMMPQKVKSGERDKGGNPFSDNLKPIGEGKRIATVKED